jgi:hypothetical protein
MMAHGLGQTIAPTPLMPGSAASGPMSMNCPPGLTALESVNAPGTWGCYNLMSGEAQASTRPTNINVANLIANLPTPAPGMPATTGIAVPVSGSSMPQWLPLLALAAAGFAVAYVLTK